MKQYGAAAVLVVDAENGKLIGICTERDLTFKVLAEGLDANTTQVHSVMTRDPQSISPEKPFGHALHMMFEGGFRHMPVVDPIGRPIGGLLRLCRVPAKAFAGVVARRQPVGASTKMGVPVPRERSRIPLAVTPNQRCDGLARPRALAPRCTGGRVARQEVEVIREPF